MKFITPGSGAGNPSMVRNDSCPFLETQKAAGSRSVALFNFSYDPVEVRLAVRRPVREVLELQPEGDWKPIGFSCRKNLLTVEKTLETAGIGIYRLR